MFLNDFSEKPEKIVLALKALYLAVGVGVIQTIITVLRHVDVRSPYALLFTKSLIYAAAIFLTYQISKQQNWARWTLLAMVIIGLPLTILPAFESFSHNPIQALSRLLQMALYVAALVLLFHESSSSWFGKGKTH
jgi:hypothetical protein